MTNLCIWLLELLVLKFSQEAIVLVANTSRLLLYDLIKYILFLSSLFLLQAFFFFQYMDVTWYEWRVNLHSVPWSLWYYSCKGVLYWAKVFWIFSFNIVYFILSYFFCCLSPPSLVCSTKYFWQIQSSWHGGFLELEHSTCAALSKFTRRTST